MAISLLGRAQENHLIEVGVTNPRDFCTDKHQKVDDTPFGGEPGMLIKAEPVALAIESLKPASETQIVLTAPTGKLFTQNDALALSESAHIVFLCGRYEGFDHRIQETFATHVFSIGDYVLTNGELPALVMADSIARLVPGVVGEPGSLRADSHSDGLLSAPNYTRPETWRGQSVPEVLLSGNHQEIKKWRRRESLKLTAENRPDLLAKADLTKDDVTLLRLLAEQGEKVF
jgi:tRNA (guanine37-N1)-methyltransferase